MLSIVFKSGWGDDMHVPYDKEYLRRVTYTPQNMQDVFYIQADGHELEDIKAKIDNIPMPKGRVVKWYGDIARTILGSL